MSPPVALIIGCGVAGPVLAALLKGKGYHVIVFEKVAQLGDAGASLMLMPNGMKVLGLVGLAHEVAGQSLPLAEFRDITSSGETLGYSTLPAEFTRRYGRPAVGVKRTTLNIQLKETLEGMDIEVREGWQLEGIKETEDSVTAFFNGNRSVTGSILIGCDGIKAASRRMLLEQNGVTEGIPQFTGLTQTAGISKTPESLRGSVSLRNWYGEGMHMIAYPISRTQTSWAITLPESTGSEVWGIYSQTQMKSVKEKLLSSLTGWEPAAIQMIESAERIIKYGLFDRRELDPKQWYTRRCVLVGDAAHPTSPHLGQGANQALEDCYHLSQLLPTVCPEDEKHTCHSASGASQYLQAFRTYAERRQPRTSVLVKGARIQGEKRVVLAGFDACQERNKNIVASWKDVSAITAKYGALCQEPFRM